MVYYMTEGFILHKIISTERQNLFG